jgi:hypothetical protein
VYARPLIKDEHYTLLLETILNRLYWTDVNEAPTLAIARGSSIDKLIPLIKSERQQTLEAFTRLQRDIDSINILANQFKRYIENIIHEADRSTLKGKCKYENGQFHRSPSWDLSIV